MTLTLDYERKLGAVDIDGPKLTEGDVIIFFGGELHRIDHFESNAGPLVEHELVPLVRTAVDDNGWRMTVPNGPVPCLPRVVVL